MLFPEMGQKNTKKPGEFVCTVFPSVASHFKHKSLWKNLKVWLSIGVNCSIFFQQICVAWYHND